MLDDLCDYLVCGAVFLVVVFLAAALVRLVWSVLWWMS